MFLVRGTAHRFPERQQSAPSPTASTSVERTRVERLLGSVTDPSGQSARTGATCRLADVHDARRGCWMPDVEYVPMRQASLYLTLVALLQRRKGINQPASDSVKSPDGEEKNKGCASESSNPGSQLHRTRV